MLMEFLKLFLSGTKQTDLDIPNFHYTTFQLVSKKCHLISANTPPIQIRSIEQRAPASFSYRLLLLA